MNVQEAFKLLTLASARDGRTVDTETARVWAADLDDIDYPEAVEAAREHYRTSDRWLMPAHVIDGVTALRKAAVLSSHRHRWVVDGTCADPACQVRRP